MAVIFLLLLIAGAIYVYTKFIFKPQYRVVLTDPVTSYIKYLSSVDGISNKFEYSSSQDGALIFKDPNRAELFMSQVPKNAHPFIERHGIFGWKKQVEG